MCQIFETAFVQPINTKQHSLPKNRHSSSIFFLVSKEIYFKTYPKYPVEIVLFEAVKNSFENIVSEHALLARLDPIESWDMYCTFYTSKHGGGHMNDRRLPVLWKDKLHSSFTASVKGYWHPSAADREVLPRITNSELFPSRFEQYFAQP